MRMRTPPVTKPALTALIVLAILTAAIYLRSVHLTSETFVYAMDDPYIHMAMAKNFHEHNIWGTTRYEFSSSSSAPLWTLLLAPLLAATDNNVFVPLALNIFFALLTLLTFASLLQRSCSGMSERAQTLLLVIVVLITPMGSLVFGGMEHMLHVLLALLFVHVSAHVLSGAFTRHEQVSLLLIGALMASTRYEGCFLVCITSGLLIVKKQWGFGISLALVSALPLVAYGIISLAHESYFLPNSILQKGQFPDLTSIKGIAVFLGARIVKNRELSALMAGAVIVFLTRRQLGIGMWEKNQTLLLLFAGATFAHVQHARTGWLYRYEAYLTVIGFYVLSAGIFSLRREANKNAAAVPKLARFFFTRTGAVLCAAVVVAAMASRGVYGNWIVPQASKNIYEQQYQMARFMRTYYSGAIVAANDIGALNFYADIRCLDLAAIGSIEPVRIRMEKRYDVHSIDSLTRAKNVRIAVLYDLWFARPPHYMISKGRQVGLPSHWKKIGWWAAQDIVILGADTVSFYAVAENEDDRLRRSLREFDSSLPPDVLRGGEYLERK
jgi:hypothetical protein